MSVLERRPRRRQAALRCLLFVVGLRQRQLRLKRLEPRRGARLEAIARGVARPFGQDPQLARDLHAAGRGDQLEVARRAPAGRMSSACTARSAVVLASVALARSSRRATLAAELERQAQAEDFVRRIARRFERGFGIRPLAGDVDARQIHGAAEPRGDERGIVLFGAGERRLQRERRGGRRLGRLVGDERRHDDDECARGSRRHGRQSTSPMMNGPLINGGVPTKCLEAE